MAAFLAGVTTAVHFLALLYIGLGGFVAWRWPRSLFVHVFFAAWGFLVIAFPLTCPLTALEDNLRGLQGLGPLPNGFNEHYIYGELVPRSLVPLAGLCAVLLLVVSYVGAYLRWQGSQQDDDLTEHRVQLS